MLVLSPGDVNFIMFSFLVFVLSSCKINNYIDQKGEDITPQRDAIF